MKKKEIKLSDVQKYLNYYRELKEISEAGVPFISKEIADRHKVTSNAVTAAKLGGLLKIIGPQNYQWLIKDLQPIHARNALISFAKYQAERNKISNKNKKIKRKKNKTDLDPTIDFSTPVFTEKPKQQEVVSEVKQKPDQTRLNTTKMHGTVRELYLFGIPIYKKVQKTV